MAICLEFMLLLGIAVVLAIGTVIIYRNDLYRMVCPDYAFRQLNRAVYLLAFSTTSAHLQ